MSAIACLAGFSAAAVASGDKSYLHEGRFCSGDYWTQPNGKSGPVERNNAAQSMDVRAPAGCGKCYIAVFDSRDGSGDYDYAWIKLKDNWRAFCVSFMNEGNNTPSQTWIDRTTHSIWFSSGRGLEG
jgi:hypothetical protein